jgi:hypothetical protein
MKIFHRVWHLEMWYVLSILQILSYSSLDFSNRIETAVFDRPNIPMIFLFLTDH